VNVRAAHPEDIGALVAAYDWLFAPPGSKPPTWDPSAAAERLAEAIGSQPAEVFVAEIDGSIAGFVTVYDEFNSVRFGHRAWVEDLAVDPERRSQGLGKALLDAAKDWARERGASHLELDSAETRADAHRFYEREEPSWKSVSFGWLLQRY
jgi:GNAT superfamily N-acetyltransferase